MLRNPIVDGTEILAGLRVWVCSPPTDAEATAAAINGLRTKETWPFRRATVYNSDEAGNVLIVEDGKGLKAAKLSEGRWVSRDDVFPQSIMRIDTSLSEISLLDQINEATVLAQLQHRMVSGNLFSTVRGNLLSIGHVPPRYFAKEKDDIGLLRCDYVRGVRDAPHPFRVSAEALHGLRRGLPQAIVTMGAPGSGKTVLLRYALRFFLPNAAREQLGKIEKVSLEGTHYFGAEPANIISELLIPMALEVLAPFTSVRVGDHSVASTRVGYAMNLQVEPGTGAAAGATLSILNPVMGPWLVPSRSRGRTFQVLLGLAAYGAERADFRGKFRLLVHTSDYDIINPTARYGTEEQREKQRRRQEEEKSRGKRLSFELDDVNQQDMRGRVGTSWGISSEVGSEADGEGEGDGRPDVPAPPPPGARIPQSGKPEDRRDAEATQMFERLLELIDSLDWDHEIDDVMDVLCATLLLTNVHFGEEAEAHMGDEMSIRCFRDVKDLLGVDEPLDFAGAFMKKTFFERNGNQTVVEVTAEEAHKRRDSTVKSLYEYLLFMIVKALNKSLAAVATAAGSKSSHSDRPGILFCDLGVGFEDLHEFGEWNGLEQLLNNFAAERLDWLLARAAQVEFQETAKQMTDSGPLELLEDPRRGILRSLTEASLLPRSSEETVDRWLRKHCEDNKFFRTPPRDRRKLNRRFAVLHTGQRWIVYATKFLLEQNAPHIPRAVCRCLRTSLNPVVAEMPLPLDNMEQEESAGANLDGPQTVTTDTLGSTLWRRDLQHIWRDLAARQQNFILCGRHSRYNDDEYYEGRYVLAQLRQLRIFDLLSTTVSSIIRVGAGAFVKRYSIMYSAELPEAPGFAAKLILDAQGIPSTDYKVEGTPGAPMCFVHLKHGAVMYLEKGLRCVFKIQDWVHAKKHRMYFQEQRQRCIQIQESYRCMKANLRKLQVQHSAVAQMQAMWRRWRAMEDLSRLQWPRVADILQRRWQAYKDRRWFNAVVGLRAAIPRIKCAYKKHNTAVLLLQRTWRGRNSRRQHADKVTELRSKQKEIREYFYFSRYAIRIQSAWRGARIRFQYWRLIVASVMVQSSVRAVLWRSYWLRIVMVTRRMQVVFRSFQQHMKLRSSVWPRGSRPDSVVPGLSMFGSLAVVQLKELEGFNWTEGGWLGGLADVVSAGLQPLSLAVGDTASFCLTWAPEAKTTEVYSWSHTSALSKNLGVPQAVLQRLGARGGHATPIPLRFVGFGTAWICELTCGERHCLAMTALGQVFAWGDNTYGQCGAGQLVKACMEPKIVELGAGAGEGRVTNVSAGPRCSAFLMADAGTVRMCGVGIGFAHSAPRIRGVPGLMRCKKVCCGRGFHFALSTSGKLFCWGTGAIGQLGLGLVCKASEVRCIEKCHGWERWALPTIRDLSVGPQHVMAITTVGEPALWGLMDIMDLSPQEPQPRTQLRDGGAVVRQHTRALRRPTKLVHKLWGDMGLLQVACTPDGGVLLTHEGGLLGFRALQRHSNVGYGWCFEPDLYAVPRPPEAPPCRDIFFHCSAVASVVCGRTVHHEADEQLRSTLPTGEKEDAERGPRPTSTRTAAANTAMGLFAPPTRRRHSVMGTFSDGTWSSGL